MLSTQKHSSDPPETGRPRSRHDGPLQGGVCRMCTGESSEGDGKVLLGEVGVIPSTTQSA